MYIRANPFLRSMLLSCACDDQEDGNVGERLQRREGSGEFGSQPSSQRQSHYHHGYAIAQHDAAILSGTSSQAQGRQEEPQNEGDEDSCSPPPHLSVSTTQTTTPTSTETVLSGQENQPLSHVPAAPSPIAEFPPGGVSSTRSEQGPSWHSPSLRLSSQGPANPESNPDLPEANYGQSPSFPLAIEQHQQTNCFERWSTRLLHMTVEVCNVISTFKKIKQILKPSRYVA